jgi:DedD protein
MDAALKQRLIGATVLVALAVIFLPMLIDGPEAEREAESEQLSLDLPTRPDRPMETREIALQPAPLPTPVVPAAGSDVLPVVDTGAEQRVDALSGEPVGAASDPASSTASSASAASAPAAARTDATPPAATGSTSSPPSATPRPAATAPVSPRPPAAAPAASAPAPVPALPTATAGGRYAVNVGSYANVANAENLLARLKNAGIAAYSESVNLEGRPVRRVRLGPFAQRSEAERARQAALAVQRDLPTSVISLDAGSPAPAPARAAATEGFAVQLGALRSEADANALRDRARGAGFVAFVERVNAEAGVLWRVRVGPELDRASAERRRGELKSKLNIDGLVVSHP